MKFGDRTRPRSGLGLLGLVFGGPGSLAGPRRLDLGGELLELLREGRTEALELRALAVPGEVELLREVLLGELLHRGLRRLDRLDLQRPVGFQAGRGRD